MPRVLWAFLTAPDAGSGHGVLPESPLRAWPTADERGLGSGPARLTQGRGTCGRRVPGEGRPRPLQAGKPSGPAAKGRVAVGRLSAVRVHTICLVVPESVM